MYPTFFPQVFHIINKKYCSFYLKFFELSTKKFPHFPSSFSCYLTKHILTLFSLLTKSIPLFSLKFSTLFNKKHCTFFSQTFKVINKWYLTFLKCFSCYLIESNPFFFIANNNYPTIFLQVSTLFNKKHYTLFPNFFHLI
jgi:hypothetical protein